MSPKLFGPTVDTLSKSLDLHLLRHAVISDNLANAETPFYKARRVDFEQELQRAVASQESGGASRAIQSVRPNVYQDFRSEMGQDLNSVDLDREMALLNKNQMKYSANKEAISRKFMMLKYAITEGGQ